MSYSANAKHSSHPIRFIQLQNILRARNTSLRTISCVSGIMRIQGHIPGAKASLFTFSSLFRPCGRNQRKEQRIYLKSAEKHRCGKHDFRKCRLSRERAHRTDSAESGTDIVIACGNRRNVCFKIKRFKAEEKKHCKVYHHI